MTRDDVILNIKVNYEQYGVDDQLIEDSIKSGEEKGFSYQTIYTGLRMALSNMYNVEENFTVQEVADAMGVSDQEVIAEIERLRAEALENGEDPDEVAYKTEPQETERFIIPAGFFK